VGVTVASRSNAMDGRGVVMNTVIFDSKHATPSKVICIGRNYVEHINELGNDLPTEPVIFMKPNSAISDTLYFDPVDVIHYEGEFSFITENNQIVGVGFGLDLTKRDLQKTLQSKGLPWKRAKAFNRAAVFSEFVRFTGDVTTLSLRLTINDAVVQQVGVELMIFKPEVLLPEIIKSFRLEDGDIIMTGTSRGVGAYAQGDKFIGQVFSGGQCVTEYRWTALQSQREVT